MAGLLIGLIEEHHYGLLTEETESRQKIFLVPVKNQISQTLFVLQRLGAPFQERFFQRPGLFFFQARLAVLHDRQIRENHLGQ